MKKTAIAMLMLAMGIVAASCQKEAEPEIKSFEPMTINAVSEGIGTTTKTEMIYKYAIAWSANDKIYVTDGASNDTFTLSGGAGTTEGTFTQDGEVSFTSEVQAYYPATMVQNGSLVWPATQTNDQTIPMYCTKTVSGKVEDFSFSSLGSVLQIVFNTTVPNIVLKSIEIKDGTKPMSGRFTVDSDGKAVITAGDVAAITLDLGEEGKILGKGANYFYIAVPAGKYEDLTLTFTGTDGGKFVMTGGNLDIGHNTVGRLTLTGSKYHPVILPGEFYVSASKKVRFSPGNLRYTIATNIWSFFLNQYDCGPDTYAEGHDKEISLFTWGYGNWSTVPDTKEYLPDVVGGADFSSAQDWGSRLGDGSVWRTLTKEEAQYLFDESKRGRAVVCGINGHIIVPDTFVDPETNDGSSAFVPTDQSQFESTYEDNIYSTESDWDAMESAGAVFFPAAGYREGDTINEFNEICDFWTTTSNGLSNPNPLLANKAHMNEVKSFSVIPGNKNYGFPVRLVTDVK